MPEFRFTITADATVSKTVHVWGASIEDAHELACETFTQDGWTRDDNPIHSVYIPDPDAYEVTKPATAEEIWLRLGECLAGQPYSEISHGARSRIERALIELLGPQP